MVAVLTGALQNMISKGAKYSLFDPCKEMAYIPLGKQYKVLVLLNLKVTNVDLSFVYTADMSVQW